MDSIVLIACGKRKRVTHRPIPACDLYIGTLFKLSLQYARQLNPSTIYILSAKYGLLSLDSKVKSYNKTLKYRSPEYIEAWANNVLHQLNRLHDLHRTEITILAGLAYRKHLIPYMPNYSIPLEGLGIGQQLRRLKQLTDKTPALFNH